MQGSEIQSRLHLWRERNFREPDRGNAEVNQVLGCAEEVGELCHAVLKERQGIRGTKADHRAAAEDAVGDILIFLAGFCSYRGINMLATFEHTANEVMKRDFLNYPRTGFPEPPIDREDPQAEAIAKAWTGE